MCQGPIWKPLFLFVQNLKKNVQRKKKDKNSGLLLQLHHYTCVAIFETESKQTLIEGHA